MKILITLVYVVLIVVFANATDLASILDQFNNTVRGSCKPGSANSGQGGSGGSSSSTPSELGGSGGSSTPSGSGDSGRGSTPSGSGGSGVNITPSGLGGSGGNITPSGSGGSGGNITPSGSVVTVANVTTDQTMLNSTSSKGSLPLVRTQRDTPPCAAEENDVLRAKTISDFNTKITQYSKCQKDNCPSTNASVIKVIDQLTGDSGAASVVKVFGPLLIVLLVVAFFG